MSLATFITNAVIKVSLANPALDREGEPTAEEARDDFIAHLLYELGLGPQPVAAHAPATEPTEKKKRAAPKKAAPAPEVEALTEQMGQLAIAEVEPPAKKARKTKAKSESPKVEELKVEVPVVAAVPEKKKPGPKPKKVAEEAPAANAGAGAVTEEPTVATKKKPGPKPKSKPEGPVNVEKLTPTHKKHLKAMAEELRCAIDDKSFLAYANAMSAEEWGTKSLDEHIRAFATPAALPLAPPPTEFDEVEFNGKEYLVDPETRFVYEAVEEGAPVRNKLGVVGLLEFKDMEY